MSSRQTGDRTEEIEELRVGLKRLRIQCASLESRVALLEGQQPRRTSSATYSDPQCPPQLRLS